MLPPISFSGRFECVIHNEGTCFTVDIDNRRYLVTARHLVDTIRTFGVVTIQRGGTWNAVGVQLVGHGEGNTDITVLAPQSLFGASHSLNLTTAGLSLAEEVFFLGFPYGLWFDIGVLNAGYPMPFVKYAVVSAMPLEEGWMFLDGHNNPGFSGGPVVRRWNGKEQIVVGVISGYRNEMQPVIDEVGDPGPFRYSMNTGLVVVHDSRKVVQIIEAHPIGIEVR